MRDECGYKNGQIVEPGPFDGLGERPVKAAREWRLDRLGKRPVKRPPDGPLDRLGQRLSNGHTA